MAVTYASFPLCCGALVINNFHCRETVLEAARISLLDKPEKLTLFDKDPVDYYRKNIGSSSYWWAQAEAAKRDPVRHAQYLETYARTDSLAGYPTFSQALSQAKDSGYLSDGLGVGVHFITLNQSEIGIWKKAVLEAGYTMVTNNVNNPGHGRSRIYVFIKVVNSWDVNNKGKLIVND
jgi:hypothetical protein